MPIDQIMQALGQRSAEINVWICVKGTVWLVLLAMGLWLCQKAISAPDFRVWLLIGFLPIAWLCFETTAGYYLHESGAYSYSLEKLLPDSTNAHEHWRKAIKNRATQAAPIGLAIPFVFLAAFAFFTLATEFKGNHGLAWAIVLGGGFIAAFVYYALVVGGIATPSG